MKLTLLLLTVAFVTSNANGYGQTISLSARNESLEKVIRQIEAQSGYHFLYYKKQLEKAKPVTVQIRNASLTEALNRCFAEQPLSYHMTDKTIVIKPKEETGEALHTRKETDPGLVTVKGKVTGEEGQPVPKATVMVKGKNTVTATDGNGEFELKDIDEKATLVISSVGFYPAEHRLNGQTSIHIQLEVNVSALDEAVVVAYNTTTQRANTGAVTVVKGEAVQSLPHRSVDRSLQGMVPGLLVTSGNGAPGGGVSNFVLRGIATGSNGLYGSTVRNPLIVVDGVPVFQDHIQLHMSSSATPNTNPMAQLNPADIKSISVLKDASAISLYGSRASNGVILITTKTGKAGRTTFTLNHQTDFSRVSKNRIDVLTQQEYLELLYEAYKNRDPAMSDEAILADLKTKFPTKADGSFYAAPNWEDALYNENAVSLVNNLSISGGNEKSKYYLNFEYSTQDGVAMSTGYDRQSFRFNFENKFTPWFRFGVNSTFSNNMQHSSGASEWISPNGVPEIMSPLNPIYLEDGSLNYHFHYGASQFDRIYPTPNPIAQAQLNIDRVASYRGIGKIFGELNILRNLSLVSSLGIDFMLSENKEKNHPALFDEYEYEIGNGRLQEQAMRRTNIIANNMLRYNQRFNSDHNLSLLLSQEAQVMLEKYIGLAVLNLGLPYYDQIYNGSEVGSYSGMERRETMASWLGQANYDFRNKYFFSASIRRDGNSRFGVRSRYGTFWSLGAGWIATEEDFLKRAGGWLSYLKLRGSVGAAGNAGAIGKYTRFEQLNLSNYDDSVAVYATSPANPDIQWEQTFTWDAGLEARFWKDRISLTADIYQRNTSNVVYARTLPSFAGFTQVQDNIGNIRNKGIELSLSADVLRARNFRWNIGVTWSTNKNILLKANVPLESISGGMLGNEEGRNFNSFYLVRWAGVDPEDGRPQWLDKKGSITKTYNTANRVFVGKPQPDGFGAVNTTVAYRQLELSAMFYYQYGFQIYDGNKTMILNDGRYPYSNQSREALDRWQKPGDIAKNPRRVLNSNDGSINHSTRFLNDGDFIRLNNVMLTWRLNPQRIRKWGLTACKIFAQGTNLATWTKFPGKDPSLVNVQGATQMPYPNVRTLSLGLNLGF